MIQGNRIGTDVTGTLNLSSGIAAIDYGIDIEGDVRATVIGGSEPGEGNLVSGSVRGIYSTSSPSGIPDGTVIRGNLIGPDLSGLIAVGHQYNGVGIQIGSAKNTTIGGTAAGDGNNISRNGQVGIWLNGDGVTTNTLIQGNLIAANPGSGIEIEDWYYPGSPRSLTGTQIGGTAVGAGNVIRGNGGAGILVLDSADRIEIRGNAIYGNGGLGIDLSAVYGGDGVTANDPGDADTGANGRQNYPVLAFAQGGPTTTVQGSLNSTPNTTFTLDFYASATADPSGYGEGGRYLGSVCVTTDGAGNATFPANSLGAVFAGEVITATATDPNGSTSEFSQAFTDIDFNRPPTANAGGSYTVAEGSSVVLNGTGNDPDAGDSLTYAWDFNGDGQFDDGVGMNPTFSAAGLDGPSTVTVHLRVTDAGGLFNDDTATISVTNVAPVVSAPTTVSGMICVPVTVSGTFADPGPDTWTATVDYADGMGAQPLTLSGFGFTLNHSYNTPGTYLVVVRVTDDDGGVGTATVMVTINSGNSSVHWTYNGTKLVVTGGSPDEQIHLTRDTATGRIRIAGTLNELTTAPASSVLQIVVTSGSGDDGITLATLTAADYSKATLDGGSGRDTVIGGGANDTIDGGSGDDSLNGGAGYADVLSGGSGDDSLTDADGVASVSGGAGNDRITLTFGAGWNLNGSTDLLGNAISGGSGDDVLDVTVQNPAIRLDLNGDSGGDQFVLHGTWTRIRVYGASGFDVVTDDGVGDLELYGIEG